MLSDMLRRLRFPDFRNPPSPIPRGALNSTCSLLVHKGGLVLSNPEIVSFFWGDFSIVEIWYMQQYLAGFADYLTNNTGAPPAMEQVLSQYGVYGGRLGLSAIDQKAPASATLADIQARIISLQTDGLLPPFGPQRIFLVLTKNVVLPDFATNSLGSTLGIHGQWAPGEYYAVVPLSPSPGEKTSFDKFMQLWESTVSHELMEAATDPDPWTGWVTANNSEGADGYEFNYVVLPFGAVQKFADNRQCAHTVFTPMQFSFLTWPNWAF